MLTVLSVLMKDEHIFIKYNSNARIFRMTLLVSCMYIYINMDVFLKCIFVSIFWF